jgi:hypothetical protein
MLRILVGPQEARQLLIAETAQGLLYNILAQPPLTSL